MEQSSKIQKFKTPFNRQIEGLNIFLIQNKGKGPPGRLCSPVAADFPLLDYLLLAMAAKASQIKNFIKSPNISYQNLITNQFFIYN